MNNHKYFRIKEITDFSGNIVYKVEAADSIVDIILNDWVRYKYDNSTISEAIEHIELLKSHRIISSKIVHKQK